MTVLLVTATACFNRHREARSDLALCAFNTRGVSIVKAIIESFGLGGEIASSYLLAMTNLLRMCIIQKHVVDSKINNVLTFNF